MVSSQCIVLLLISLHTWSTLTKQYTAWAIIMSRSLAASTAMSSWCENKMTLVLDCFNIKNVQFSHQQHRISVLTHFCVTFFCRLMCTMDIAVIACIPTLYKSLVSFTVNAFKKQIRKVIWGLFIKYPEGLECSHALLISWSLSLETHKDTVMTDFTRNVYMCHIHLWIPSCASSLLFLSIITDPLLCCLVHLSLYETFFFL